MFLNRVHGCSLQNQRNLGGRVLSFLLVKIVAAIFSFYCSGRLGREKKIRTEGVRYSQKEGEGRGGAMNIIIR